jgi:hypothetical protein
MGMNQHDDSLPDGGAPRLSDPQLSDFYRAAPAENPPERLDAAIQAAARRAVGARPRAAGGSLLRAWRVPLSIAAVLVMSVSMVTLTVRHKGDQLIELPLPAGVPALSSEATTAAAAAGSPDTAGKAASASAAKSVVTGVSRQSAVADAVEPARPSGAAASKPREVPVASTGAPPPQAFVPSATPAAPAESPESRVAAAQEEQTGAPSRALARAAPAAAPEAARVEGQAMRRERAAASVGVAGDAVSPAAALVRELETQPPEKWLDKILGLRQQGRAREADELLAEFRKRHPNHPVPPSSH